MNTALTVFGISMLCSPVSTVYRTLEVGSIMYNVVKYTVGGFMYLVTPSPPPIEEGWDELIELDNSLTRHTPRDVLFVECDKSPTVSTWVDT